jgi:hypothetical protein
LKEHLMLWFGVGQRTLQTWLRAGLIPNTTRTKRGKGHYRIRAPKGVKPEHYQRALEVFSGGGDPLEKCAAAGLPITFRIWQQQVTRNVTQYTAAMRQVRRVCRNTQAGVPFFTLKQMVKADKRYGRPPKKKKATSSPWEAACLPE